MKPQNYEVLIQSHKKKLTYIGQILTQKCKNFKLETNSLTNEAKRITGREILAFLRFHILLNLLGKAQYFSLSPIF